MLRGGSVIGHVGRLLAFHSSRVVTFKIPRMPSTGRSSEQALYDFGKVKED